jgi:hypothetical protein
VRHFLRLFGLNTYITCVLLGSLYSPIVLFSLAGLPGLLVGMHENRGAR